MTDFRALCAELTDALNNLHALVWGECPSLLDEDRGGSGFLDLEIEETLTTARAALSQPEPVAPLINSGSERLRLVAVGIRSGYMAGHDATVEGYYGDPDEVASEMASMVLAELNSVPQPEPVAPVAPTDEELLAMRSWSSHGPTFDSDLVDFGRRCYNLAKQPVSTPFKLPEPVAPTDEELIRPIVWMIDDRVYDNDKGEIAESLRELVARWGQP